MAFGEFEKINCPIKIVLHQLPAARRTIYASQHTWVRGRVHNPFHGWQHLDVRGIPNIRMDKLHSRTLERLAVQFASRPHEVVQANYFDPGVILEKRAGQPAADEAANSCD